MRRCKISLNALFLGLGLLAGVVLPEEWIAVIAIIVLVIVAISASHRGRRC